jgi:hypothetical protein
MLSTKNSNIQVIVFTLNILVLALKKPQSTEWYDQRPLDLADSDYYASGSFCSNAQFHAFYIIFCL